MKKLNVTFPAGEVEIELLSSPAVNRYVRVLENYNANDIPLATQMGSLMNLGYDGLKIRQVHLEEEYVNSINAAIDRFNEITTGERWPYRAWIDMPWSQTNLIHRCFTVAMGNRLPVDGQDPTDPETTWTGILRHNLTNKQLQEYKLLCYDDKGMIGRITEPTFFYKYKDQSLIHELLERINHGVHMYENIRYSHASAGMFDYEIPAFLKENGFNQDWGMEVNLMWDVYTESGEKTFFEVEALSSSDVERSIPSNWMDYDVFAIKSITGKDYETAFQNYDNPLEYDIQNAQDITGGLRIFPQQAHKVLYGESSFGTYLRNYGLTYKQYAPIPLGKVTKSTFDLCSIRPSKTEKNSDGSPAMLEPFINPKITLSNNDSVGNLL